jgi:release factor glutamine methyltransferase
MARSLNERLIPPGARVLDMGTGSGIGAVFAAQWTDRVTAVDINPAAVRCARINVLLNEVEDCVTVKEGDLFTAVPAKPSTSFSLTHPTFPANPKTTWTAPFAPTM